MTPFSLPRLIAKETAIGVVINAFVAIAPRFLLTRSFDGTSRFARDVAVDLLPQFFMAALMSALVPSLLICWRASKGRFPGPQPSRPFHAAAVSVVLAVLATIITLGMIHIVVAPMAANGLTIGAVLVLQGGQAGLSAAVVTPIAIILLLRRSSERIDG